MLKALADGETDPAALASLADKNLRATPAQLYDALAACTELNPVYRQLLKMFLEELQLIDQQTGQLDKEMATLLSQDQAAVERLAEVPAWVWIQRSTSLPKWVPRPRHSLRPSTSLPGWERAQERTRAREYPRATAPPRATAICGAFSISVPTPQPSRKEPFSRSSMADWCRAWDTIKPSAPLPIGVVA